MSDAKSSGGDDKLIGIELLRFASAVAVLIFHYRHFTMFGAAPPVAVEQMPFFSPLRLFYDFGFHGVQVFWCISGFIFYWKYGQTISQQRLSGYKFFILRISRLYPLHLATLLIVGALQYLYFARNGRYFIYEFNDLYHFILQLFMASNWGFQHGDSFNGPIWSISIEVLVYCFFFLSLRYVSGAPVFIALVFLGAAAIYLPKFSDHWFFSCLMFFYLGCLTAIAYTRISPVPRYRLWATVAALAVIAATLAAGLYVPVSRVLILLALSPALIYLCATYIPATAHTSRALAAAGSMTYSSYLLHVPVQLLAVLTAGYAGFLLPVRSAAFFLGYLALILVISFYCFKYFEIPAQNYLRRQFGRTR